MFGRVLWEYFETNILSCLIDYFQSTTDICVTPLTLTHRLNNQTRETRLILDEVCKVSLLYSVSSFPTRGECTTGRPVRLGVGVVNEMISGLPSESDFNSVSPRSECKGIERRVFLGVFVSQ